ncbi:MAG: winged helix-turn-helix domain-containing protein [Candidatus Njordarchaeota archaeon]
MARKRNNEERYRILKFLQKNKDRPDITVKTVAEYLKKSIKTTSYTINTMAQDGLILKKTIGRTSFLRITYKGEDFIRHYEEQHKKQTKQPEQQLQQQKTTKKKKTIPKKQKQTQKPKQEQPQKPKPIPKKQEEVSLGVSGGSVGGVFGGRFVPRRVRVHDFKVKLVVDLLDTDSLSRLFPWAVGLDVGEVLRRCLGDGRVVRSVVKRYWEAFYFSVPLEGVDVTLEATTRSVVLHFRARDFDFGLDVVERIRGYVFSVVAFVVQFIVERTPLRVVRVEPISIEYAVPLGGFWDEKLPKRMRMGVELPRRAVSPIGELRRSARDWFDRSFGEVEWETNDFVLAELFLEMPLRIAWNTEGIEELHRKVNALAFSQKKLAEAQERIADILGRLFGDLLGGEKKEEKGAVVEEKFESFDDIGII